jgi:hypothetical protein
MTLALNPSFGSQPLLNVYPTKARLYIVGCNQVEACVYHEVWAYYGLCWSLSHRSRWLIR